MTQDSMIVDRAVDLLMPSGERVPFRVEFGPVRQQGHGFRCSVRYHGGLEDSPPDIAGYDSLHALLLAVELVRSMLVSFVKRGGRVVWPGTLKNYDLKGFGIGGSTGELGAAPNGGAAASATSSEVGNGPQSVDLIVLR